MLTLLMVADLESRLKEVDGNDVWQRAFDNVLKGIDELIVVILDREYQPKNVAFLRDARVWYLF